LIDRGEQVARSVVTASDLFAGCREDLVFGFKSDRVSSPNRFFESAQTSSFVVLDGFVPDDLSIGVRIALAEVVRGDGRACGAIFAQPAAAAEGENEKRENESSVHWRPLGPLVEGRVWSRLTHGDVDRPGNKAAWWQNKSLLFVDDVGSEKIGRWS
jgi:hypothetical protein